jgi:hypothetical protein
MSSGRVLVLKAITSNEIDPNPSLPAEQPLDVGEFQLDAGRPAMVALAGARRAFHLAQQRVHLFAGKPAALSCASKILIQVNVPLFSSTKLVMLVGVPFDRRCGGNDDR